MRTCACPCSRPLLTAAALGATTAATADQTPARDYVVVFKPGASAQDARAAIAQAGGKVLDENAAIGVATVRSQDGAFASKAAGQKALEGAAPNTADRLRPARRRSARATHRAARLARQRRRGQGERREAQGAARCQGPGAARSALRPAVGHADDRRHDDRLLRPPAGLARRPRGHHRHRRRRHAPGHRAELRRGAVAQLHHRRSRSSTAPATPIRTSRATTRRTWTRTATARTWRARSAPR